MDFIFLDLALSQSGNNIGFCSSSLGNGVSDGSDKGLEAGLAMFERCLKRTRGRWQWQVGGERAVNG